MAALDASLNVAFTEALASPSLASGGATVFPATGVLGKTTPTLDPTTLVGQEIPTFDLGLSATGTVVTADTTPVDAIAETQLRATVKPDHQLVAGTVDITVGGAVIAGQTVTFPVSATAKQVALLDPGDAEGDGPGQVARGREIDPERLWRRPGERLSELDRVGPELR